MAQNTEKLVSAYKSSGLTQREFCKNRGIAVSSLQYHLLKSKKNSTKNVNISKGTFLPVSISRESTKVNSLDRTVILIHGNIQIPEISQLLQTLSR